MGKLHQLVTVESQIYIFLKYYVSNNFACFWVQRYMLFQKKIIVMQSFLCTRHISHVSRKCKNNHYTKERHLSPMNRNYASKIACFHFIRGGFKCPIQITLVWSKFTKKGIYLKNIVFIHTHQHKNSSQGPWLTSSKLWWSIRLNSYNPCL